MLLRAFCLLLIGAMAALTLPASAMEQPREEMSCCGETHGTCPDCPQKQPMSPCCAVPAPVMDVAGTMALILPVLLSEAHPSVATQFSERSEIPPVPPPKS